MRSQQTINTTAAAYQFVSEMITYIVKEEELLNISLNDLDQDYAVAPSTLGLDYNLICNKWFARSINY